MLASFSFQNFPKKVIFGVKSLEPMLALCLVGMQVLALRSVLQWLMEMRIPLQHYLEVGYLHRCHVYLYLLYRHS